jgi:hypothetical protein
MPRFHAFATLSFEADSVRDGAQRMRDLAEAVESAGFQLVRGTVEAANDSDEDERGTGYGPAIS